MHERMEDQKSQRIISSLKKLKQLKQKQLMKNNARRLKLKKQQQRRRRCQKQKQRQEITSSH